MHPRKVFDRSVPLEMDEEDKGVGKNYYNSLSFTYVFNDKCEDSTVLFAESIPYTFSNLIEFIEVIEC